ncbi:MAG: LacI family DNA-binding transcriptional regulator [Clostridia bacterium]|nr:LacI family DNA-binding transcriptional regulator [Clostridia bacterium]
MAKRVTIDDIAEAMQISKTQVSRALRDVYGVSEETRSQIIVKAYEMGYDMSNIRRKKKQGRRVGVVIPKSDLADEFFYLRMVYNLEKIFNDQRIDFKLCIMEEGVDAKTLITAIREYEVSMLLTVGMVPDDIISALSSTGYPLAAIDARSDGLRVNRLCFNNYAGTYQLTRYILSNGHKRVVFAGDPEFTYNFRQRYLGYETCMKESGFEASHIHFTRSGTCNDSELDRLLHSNSAPTAFVCANDRIAFALYEELARRGLSIPKDVSVVGFDNVDRCEWSDPPLTSIDFNPRIIADAAATLLMECVKYPEATTRCVTLDANLIIRQSVAHLKDNQ